jgi:hypothetical protein
MKKIKYKYLFISFFLGCSYLGVAQNGTSNQSSYIISLNPVYSSNIFSVNRNGYDDLYFIKSNRSIKIDSLMSALSKRDYYTNEANILTELKSQFIVYTIIKDTAQKKNKTDYIGNLIMNYNNYKTAYFFAMSDSVRKYSSIVAYVIQIYNTQSKIKYEVLNNSCDTLSRFDCRVVIKKLSK